MEILSFDPATDRRKSPDRRRRVPEIRSLFKYRRRGRLRRVEDCRRLTLLDTYPQSLLILVVLVMGLSIIDAFMTLFLIEHGAVEINPLMNHFLKMGPYAFVLAKYFMTAFSIVIVVVVGHACIPRFKWAARNLMTFFVCCFAAVIVWQIYLTVRFIL